MIAEGLGIVARVHLGFQATSNRFAFFQTGSLTSPGTTTAGRNNTIALTRKTPRATILGSHGRQVGSIRHTRIKRSYVLAARI